MTDFTLDLQEHTLTVPADQPGILIKNCLELEIHNGTIKTAEPTDPDAQLSIPTVFTTTTEWRAQGDFPPLSRQ